MFGRFLFVVRNCNWGAPGYTYTYFSLDHHNIKEIWFDDEKREGGFLRREQLQRAGQGSSQTAGQICAPKHDSIYQPDWFAAGKLRSWCPPFWLLGFIAQWWLQFWMSIPWLHRKPVRGRCSRGRWHLNRTCPSLRFRHQERRVCFPWECLRDQWSPGFLVVHANGKKWWWD